MTVRAFIDASYGVHQASGKSHTGCAIMLGEAGVIFARSILQAKDCDEVQHRGIVGWPLRLSGSGYPPKKCCGETRLLRWSCEYLLRQTQLHGFNESRWARIRKVPPYQHSSFLGGGKSGKRRSHH
jgi:hypothetical protein